MFYGNYKYSIDSKGRVSIPAKLRREVNPDANDTFVMTIGTETCIEIYPKDEWDILAKKIKQLNSFNRKAARIKRLMFGNINIDKLDTQSRLLLPKNLIEYAGIEKEVLIIGNDEKIEIWNQKKYDEYLNKENELFYPDALEDVMGNDEIINKDEKE